MNHGPGIRVESVAKEYATPAGLVRALDGITLDVASRSSVAIMGPSGCGKSTLLGLIGGLDVPSRGRIVVDGHELSSLRERERARLRRDEFGFVFQSDNLMPFLTATENVALQLALHGAISGFDRCRDLLTGLGLEACLDKLPDQLSGGQRQRVAVARALIHEPRVILADEPTGALDADSSASVLDLLVEAQRAAGAMLVVVTHDPTVARQLDRTVVLHDGRLASDTQSLETASGRVDA